MTVKQWFCIPEGRLKIVRIFSPILASYIDGLRDDRLRLNTQIHYGTRSGDLIEGRREIDSNWGLAPKIRRELPNENPQR